MCCFELIFEGTPHETRGVRPLISHLKNPRNKTNKACEALLEKQRRTHYWRSSRDLYIWTLQCWLTHKDLHQLWMPFEEPAETDRWPMSIGLCRIREFRAIRTSWWYILNNERVGIRYPDESLRRNCSRLVPNSRNNFCNYIYIYIYISCHAARTDFPNSLSPSVSINHHFQQFFQTTSCVRTELL